MGILHQAKSKMVVSNLCSAAQQKCSEKEEIRKKKESSGNINFDIISRK